MLPQQDVDFDAELMRRCQPLLEIRRFDDAVNNAFRLLEERLRRATGIKGENGPNLAVKAFGENSVLLTRMDADPGMANALRQLYAGAFGVFRNATAHHLDVYDAEECYEILTLVNLLLRLISKADSPKALLKEAFKKWNTPSRIQSWCIEITSTLSKWNPNINFRPAGNAVGLYSPDKAFSYIYPSKERLLIDCFTRGEPLEGTGVIGTNNPRWGRLSVKSQLQVPSAIETLRESYTRLIDALLASEPTGYSTGGAKTDSAVNDSAPKL